MQKMTLSEFWEAVYKNPKIKKTQKTSKLLQDIYKGSDQQELLDYISNNAGKVQESDTTMMPPVPEPVPNEKPQPVIIITPWTYSPTGRGERSTRPSLTVPDQSMSLQTILQKFATGQPIDGVKAEIWNGDEEDLPDVKKMDLTEIDDLMTEYKNRIKAMQNEYELRSKEHTTKPVTVTTDTKTQDTNPETKPQV